MSRSWKDVTVPIRNGMPCWVEDPPVEVHRRLSIEGGNDFNISSLSMSSHTGTHMDAPLHFIPGAPGLEEMPFFRMMTNAPSPLIDASQASAR